MNGASHYDGTTKKSKSGAVWTGHVAIAPDHILQAPLGWKRPRRIFVNSMGDLFHEAISDKQIDLVFAVMAQCPQHTFQVLTKRAARMRDYATNPDLEDRLTDLWRGDNPDREMWNILLPLSNVWLGVSAERQQEADERISQLLQTPAAVRFVSAEPLLGPVDFARFLWVDEECEYIGARRQMLHQIIVGGESGQHARPMAKTWAESIRDQCAASNTKFFMKQMSGKKPIPPDLMVREFPTVS